MFRVRSRHSRSSVGVDGSAPEALTQYFEGRTDDMLEALGKLVDMDSPSEDLEAIEDFTQALQLYVETETKVGAEIIRARSKVDPMFWPNWASAPMFCLSVTSTLCTRWAWPTRRRFGLKKAAPMALASST